MTGGTDILRAHRITASTSVLHTEGGSSTLSVPTRAYRSTVRTLLL